VLRLLADDLTGRSCLARGFSEFVFKCLLPVVFSLPAANGQRVNTNPFRDLFVVDLALRFRNTFSASLRASFFMA